VGRNPEQVAAEGDCFAFEIEYLLSAPTARGVVGKQKYIGFEEIQSLSPKSIPFLRLLGHFVVTLSDNVCSTDRNVEIILC
jgi:hypothetical protein